MKESQNNRKWGRALMQLLEVWGSRNNREMILVANGTFKNKFFDFSQKKKNEEQKFTLEYSSKETAVVTYEKKNPLRLYSSKDIQF